jgi:hypothetical protein
MAFNLRPNVFQGWNPIRCLLPIRSVDAEVARDEHGSVREGDSQGEHVIPRLTVFHASISGRVVPDHPPDSTQILTARIGSESNTSIRQIRIQFGKEEPRLDRHALTRGVESDNLVEARRVQDHAGTDGRPR